MGHRKEAKERKNMNEERKNMHGLPSPSQAVNVTAHNHVHTKTVRMLGLRVAARGLAARGLAGVRAASSARPEPAQCDSLLAIGSRRIFRCVSFEK